MSLFFVKLTHGGDRKTAIYFNVAQISAMIQERDGTKIFTTGDQEPFLVSEAPEEIIAKAAAAPGSSR